jgi:hypothetical protein
MFELMTGMKLGMPLASLEDIIGITGGMLVVFAIPVVAILTNHQRKMAELIHRNQPQQVDPMIQQQLASMQSQISDMRTMMQEHIINNDRPSTPNSVEQRLNQ